MPQHKSQHIIVHQKHSSIQLPQAFQAYHNHPMELSIQVYPNGVMQDLQSTRITFSRNSIPRGSVALVQGTIFGNELCPRTGLNPDM